MQLVLPPPVGSINLSRSRQTEQKASHGPRGQDVHIISTPFCASRVIFSARRGFPSVSRALLARRGLQVLLPAFARRHPAPD